MRASIELELGAKEAFDQFVSQLTESLEKSKIEFKLGEKGEVIEDSIIVGKVTEWTPPKTIELEWRTAATWDSKDVTRLRFLFEPLDNGRTKITIENDSWGGLVGDRGAALNEWFADEIASNILEATSPKRFVNWLTDRRARRPQGAAARKTYRDPIYHRPNFLAILDYLKLKENDYLFELGCGGGAFLFDALKSGCRAAAIDHSPDMVKVAREVNSEAIKQKRLEIRESEADTIPYDDEQFTCAVCTGVFAFIDRPVVVLSEVYRVLSKGGRLVLFTGSKEMKGTPAAPEPLASQLHFYEDEELIGLARKAGFKEARIEKPNFEPYARAAKVPEEAMPLFMGTGGSQFLLARKT
jgi:SAM-dependent methyltransferase